MKSFRIWHQLRTSMWPIPVLCVLVGVAVSFATVALDTGAIVSVEFIGGPDAALAILGAIAASMVTLTGIVLTIVLVVVQLAMGQFSPRIVPAILHDRPSQFAIGIFVAAFAHAMLAMREIASTEEGAPVPGLSILVAFGLVVVSIVALILYINHIGQSLRAAALIESVGKETREVLDKLYEDRGPDPLRDDPNVILAPESGVVFRIDYHDLVAAASDANIVRLYVSHITWEGYVRLAFDEIRQTGASSAQVTRRLKAALEDLLTVAPADRRAPLERQLELLEAAVANNEWTDTERSDMSSSDLQGIGSARELRSIVEQV